MTKQHSDSEVVPRPFSLSLVAKWILEHCAITRLTSNAKFRTSP